MKKKEIVGLDKMHEKMWKIIGDISIGWLKDVFNKVLVEAKILEY